jgi:hypothetical protein
LRAGQVDLAEEDFTELATALAAGHYDEGPALPWPTLDEWRVRGSASALA